MSLWSIPDKTTSEIMTDFYANWRNGIPKDVALQRAKRAYLQRTTPQFTLPNYWAATVVIGDLSAIETPPMGSLLWDKWLAAAAIVLFTVLIFLKKKSPRKS